MSALLEAHSVHMGGTFTIKVYPQSYYERDQVESIIRKSFDEVRRIETLLTDFSDSPFNKINDHAGIHPVKVDEETFQLIKESIEFSKVSRGIFDISYASVGHLWRKYLKEGIPPKEEDIQKAKQYIDYRLIELDKEKRTVYLPHSLMKISLGGIGKGYAVDRLYYYLRQEGLENFQVNGSGDIRVHSSTDAPRAWRIGIQNPFSNNDKKLMGYLEVANGAVATSGDYKQTKIFKGRKIHHIISPSTGYSINEVVSATVFSSRAITADVYGTICLLHSAEKAIEILDEAELKGFVVHKSGKVFASQKVSQQFNQQGSI